MTGSFNIQCLDAAQIQRIRDDIYLGCGYHIVRGFLQPQQVEHLVSFWDKHHNQLLPQFRKQKHIFENCPDYSVVQPEMRRHFNFFWNKPLEPFTYETAWQLQALRNRIEGQPLSFEVLPHVRNSQREYRAVSYRVVSTLEGGAVGHHVDYAMDHSRVQVSVILSNAGEDYTSGGFVFYDKFRGGAPRNLSFEENLRAGDLILFRYGQKHGVDAVTTPPGGRGFVRILMPKETIPIGESGNRGSRLVRKLKSKLRKKKGGKAESEELYYDEEVLQLMQIAVRRGFEPSEVYYHKGLWGRFRSNQDWQWNALQKYGLKTGHHFLDIGSGMGRLAMKLVPYLEDDHYCGVDPVSGFVELSDVYLREVVKTDKTYHISCNHDFDFAQFNRKFDFAMSHAVFTHLTLEQIEQCFAQLKPVMKPGGQLIFTIILGKDSEESFVYVEGIPMTWSSHRDMSFYEGLAKKYGFKVELLGREGHPSQEVCRATF